MFCKKCGYEIQEDSDRCPNCKCEINNIEEKNMHKEKIVKLIKENKKKVIAIVILCMVIIICIGIKVQKRCQYPKCSNTSIEGGRYCYIHTCSYSGCKNQRAYNSTYCYTHKRESEEKKSEENDKFSNYLKNNGITLTATEVQYNLANNVGEKFSLKGNASLDDYYNYGYSDDIESRYFCIRVRPTGGSYTDEWYIYCLRTSFSALYNALLEKKNISVKMVCYIDKNRYKKGQGNMASAEYAIWN